MKAEGIRRGADHVRQLTILGDGAPWIWNIATAKFPEATQIVDLFHAREHLHDLARLLEFMLGDRTGDWLAARLEDLDHGDVDGICAAARAYPLAGVKKDELDTALGYFENNAPRMRYHWFRQCGLFVGSGLVEAGLQVRHRPQACASGACTGSSTATTPSPPSAASRPAGPKTRPGPRAATRYQPPDQPRPLTALPACMTGAPASPHSSRRGPGRVMPAGRISPISRRQAAGGSASGSRGRRGPRRSWRGRRGCRRGVAGRVRRR